MENNQILDTNTIELIEQAFFLRKNKNHKEALDIYNQLIATTPKLPIEVYFNGGNIAFDLGLFEQAKEDFLIVLEHNPSFTPSILQLARIYARVGDNQKAKNYFQTLLNLEPTNFSGWLEFGHIFRSEMDFNQAIITYKQAVSIAPNRWEGWLALGRAFEDDKQYDEGAVCYHKAILFAKFVSNDSSKDDSHLEPTKPTSLKNIHWNMARYRLERGDNGRALESMRQALMSTRLEDEEIDINERAKMQIDLADILMRIGLKDEAYGAFERASMATDEGVLSLLASLSFRHNLWVEAQEVLKRNAELHPNSAEVHWNLAHSYAESWQLDDAIIQLEKAQSIAFQSGAKSMLASIAGKKGDIKTALQLYLELADEDGIFSSMKSSAVMSSLYSDELSALEVSELHKKLFLEWGNNAKLISSFKNKKLVDKKLKIGLVSADFHHQHPVNIFMQPVLAHLNKDRFDTTLYFTGIAYDNQTQIAKKRVSNWVECSKFSNEQLRSQIEKDEIDILIDLSGHTSHNKMALFASRVAPVQVSFLGYPASTGVPNIDWIIGDNIVTPVGSEELYSEKIYRLPNTVFCFSPETNYPYPTYDETIKNRQLTFGSFNNVPKITPHTVKLWARVLKEVEDSKLILKAPSFQDSGAIAFFVERFKNEGISEDRLEFRGPVGLDLMMEEYGDIDIALDTIPYNGGTTTLQAMWMGVPVVVKEGNNFVSRMGASFMSSCGMVDWVAKDDD